MESYWSNICHFRAMTLSPLHLVVNFPLFTIDSCCFISKFNFKGPSSAAKMCLILQRLCRLCAQFWVLAVCRCTNCHCEIIETLLQKDFWVNISCDLHKHFYMLPCWISIFPSFNFLMVGRVKRVNMRHGAKFRAARSNRCWENDDFLFTRWQPPSSWISKFVNFNGRKGKEVKTPSSR